MTISKGNPGGRQELLQIQWPRWYMSAL